jgi:bifunctional DNA-binding transcriptional regulator/antitoxin component of YhaV-PrlF toxin-antitoxin module
MVTGMQSKVSVRGQTVIPAPVREALHIVPKQKLSWIIRDGAAVVVPIPDDPVAASVGILRGSGYTFEDFLRERNEEREWELELEDRQDRER